MSMMSKIKEDYKREKEIYEAKEREKQARKEAKKQHYNSSLAKKKKELDEKPKSGFMVMLEATWTLVQFLPILIIGILAAIIGFGAIFLVIKNALFG